MKKTPYKFSNATTDIYFDGRFNLLKGIVGKGNAILLTDENVFEHHKEKFRNWNTIVLRAGEEYKIQSTVDSVIEQLIRMEAGRDAVLVGIGGGVITDLAGFIGSTYLRGIRFGFVPTSILGLVDASIGGKNGIDVGPYKNMVGSIRQPEFILHDLSFLESLPAAEWINGFAEIIKHASIMDPTLFRELEKGSLQGYQKNKAGLTRLISRNAALKMSVVRKDELEQGLRRTLNFGHTLGHALENQYELSHGQAISIGMGFAARLSERITGFKNAQRLIDLLNRYGLPTEARFNKTKVFNVLKMDKKRQRKEIHFILLNQIGKPVISRIPLETIQKTLNALA